MSVLREPRFLDRAIAQPRAVRKPVRRYRIVVGVDLSEYADIVIEHALDQAARHDAPEVHLLTVREKRSQELDVLKQALWDRVYPALETFNQYGTDWRARLHVRRGKPAEEIAQLAADIRANLIVIGQFGLHESGLPGRVLQQAVCPTLVVGLPEAQQTSPQCPHCAAIREETEGERWFCREHAGDGGGDHFVSTMTTWTGGSVMW